MTGATPRHLVLVGLMGAGKTTVGARCATRLERPFVDTDDLVEVLAGRTVSELFGAGEGAFREFERRAVADVSASPNPLVIACGGGAVLDAENRAALRARGFVVWLRADPSVLAERVRDDGVDRPLLAEGPLPTLVRLAETRDAAYRAVADTEVSTDRRTPDAVVDAVVEEFVRCGA
ncbi:MAG TPA: shikimate kinase [Acidimicrobiia bacterium]|nr:shikimate kinase [Acidimicrobiia bacterium]